MVKKSNLLNFIKNLQQLKTKRERKNYLLIKISIKTMSFIIISIIIESDIYINIISEIKRSKRWICISNKINNNYNINHFITLYWFRIEWKYENHQWNDKSIGISTHFLLFKIKFCFFFVFVTIIYLLFSNNRHKIKYTALIYLFVDINDFQKLSIIALL